MDIQSSRSTRARLVAQAMRLFGEKGYSATSVADIEAAAGLSPGSGSLYRHFASKRDLLAEGVCQQIDAGQGLLAVLDAANDLSHLPARERLAAVARSGLRRLEQEQDLNRIMIRDLARFPDLLARARDDEVARIHAAVAGWLSAQVSSVDEQWDWDALAAVVIGAVSHFWLLNDVFGEHPAGVDEQRYIDTLTRVLLAAVLQGEVPQ